MAIAFVQHVGDSATKASGATVAITVPAAGVTAGNSVIVYVASVTAQGISVSDTAGNTYSVDADVSNGTAVRTFIAAAHNVAALASGDTITVTWAAAVSVKAVSVDEFSGLATASALDQTTTATGSSTTPSSGAVNTTQADELLIGAIGVNGPLLLDTFTPGTGWSPGTDAGSNGGTDTTNRTVRCEYQIVAATGSYQADGTITSRAWAAAIATYKAPAAPATGRAAIMTTNRGWWGVG